MKSTHQHVASGQWVVAILIAVGCGVLPMAVVGGTPAGADRVRLQVRQSGVCKVSSGDLAIGLNLTPDEVADRIAANGLRLMSQGYEIPWFPSADGSNLYFYGEAFESLYTDSNVYWIEDGAGTPMEARSAAVASAAPAGQTFAETAHFEQNKIYANAVLRDPLQDAWVWDSKRVTGGALSMSFTAQVHNANAAFGATLTVRLVSATETTNSPDHHVNVYLNSQKVGESEWDGRGRHDLVLPCAAGLVVSGGNVLRVEAVRPPGVAASTVAFDAFEVGYRRDYVAVSNRLTFGGESHERVTVNGFGETNLFVLDVTDPKRPVRLSGFTVDAAVPPHGLTLATGGPARRFHATTEAAVGIPESVTGGEPAFLRSATLAADYLVIAPESLWVEAGEWAAYRQSQGLEVAMVSVFDIYDEFNHGLPDPAAIRDFLTWVHRNWARVPRYVLLAGNGTYDYRNLLGYGNNLVPPMLTDVDNGLMGTDFFYADVDDDGAPEFAVGRLPAATGSALRGMLAKVRQHEQPESRTQAVLFVADNPDKGGSFHDDTDGVVVRVPPEETVVRAYLTNTTVNPVAAPAAVAWVKDRMTATLNGGCRLFTYVGHAAYIWYADEQLLTEAGARGLTNRSCRPFMVSAACAASRFDRPDAESLCESLVLNTNGGAVAAWGAIDLTMNSENVMMVDRLHEGLFELGMERYGDAVGHAQASYAAAARPFNTVLQFNLLGDPATAFGSTNGLPAANPFGDPGPVGYDEWSRLQFSALERSRGLALPESDPDGDGADNGSEFAAGTDSRDPVSLLAIVDIAAGPEASEPLAAVRIAWPSVAQRLYRIDTSTNLSLGFQPYTNGVPSRPPLNTHTCWVERAETMFFRVGVE